jgi:hypothetical protein
VALTQINGEPVRLVKAFSELREGMIVWVIPCWLCRGKHRFMLLSGRNSTEFSITPNPHPDVGDGVAADSREFRSGECSVYLVIDPDITEVRRQVVRKPKERVR